MAGWRGWLRLAAGLLGVAGDPGFFSNPRGYSVSNVVAVTAFSLAACLATPVAANREDYPHPRAAALRNLTRHRRQGAATSGAYEPQNGYSPCINILSDVATGATTGVRENYEQCCAQRRRFLSTFECHNYLCCRPRPSDYVSVLSNIESTVFAFCYKDKLAVPVESAIPCKYPL